MDSNSLIGILAFTVLTLLWLAFVYAMFFNRDLLDRAWRTFRGWPLIAQVLVGLLLLPVVLGLWIWQTKWPAWLRYIVVAGLAWMTVYTFFPAI